MSIMLEWLSYWGPGCVCMLQLGCEGAPLLFVQDICHAVGLIGWCVGWGVCCNTT